MDAARSKQIQESLQKASDAYRAAAEDEMSGTRGAHGSVHNVYQFMREGYALEGKARNLARRFGVDTCNCTC